MADTRRRVKLYMLNEDRQWDDRGTGHVFSDHVERLRGMSLLVLSETDGSLLLESKILQDTAYQKQQATLIVWSEADSYDLALSFQEKIGCDEIWEIICQVQGKDPSVHITQDVADESEDERFDAMVFAASRVELPPCEINKLKEISELFNSILSSLFRREKLAAAIEAEDYIHKLVDLFHTCEDLENIDGLHHLYEILTNIFLLNSSALFEIMFSEDTILDIIGILEYDPASPTPTRHRDYLRSTAKFKEVVPMTNIGLEKKIHQTYKVQYILDVLLPVPPSLFVENMLSALSSFICFNKAEIVGMIQDDVKFLTTLFAQMTDEETDASHRRDLVFFLKELCTFSQILQQPNREMFFKTLSDLGVLTSLKILLGADDEQVKQAAIDIFSYIVEFSPTVVRKFILHECSGVGNENLLINQVIEQMINDADPELGGAVQLMGILRMLLDPENVSDTASNSEIPEFLIFFYEHCMPVLTAPLFANTTDDKLNTGDHQSAQLLALILELLTFCVGNHVHYIKNYVITQDILRRVLALLKSRHSFLVLCALRFCRKIIGLKEAFYNIHIIKENLFRPIIDAFLANGDRYNLVNSAMIELFEFIKVENIKSLSTYIMETFHKELEGIKYVKTFETLKHRYELQRKRSRDKRYFERCVSPSELEKEARMRTRKMVHHFPGHIAGTSFCCAPDEDEELEFSKRDQNHDDSRHQISEILTRWESKKAKKIKPDVSGSPSQLRSGTKSSVNVRIKTGSSSSLSSLLTVSHSPSSLGSSPPAPGSPGSSPPDLVSPPSPSSLGDSAPDSPDIPAPGSLGDSAPDSPGSSPAALGSPSSNPASPCFPSCSAPQTIPSTIGVNSLVDKPGASNNPAAVYSNANVSTSTSVTTTTCSSTTSSHFVADSLPFSSAVTTKKLGHRSLVDFPDENSEEEEADREEDVRTPSSKRQRMGT